jgi:hypothetical protein
VDKSNGFSLGGADCTRGPVALDPFDVARSSDWMDEQERYMQGDGTEGGAGGGGRVEAGAEEEARSVFMAKQ